ncbi:MAG: glutamine-hydrolyzing carbamoyl-phosphate synthase small subunit [Candidatus Bathyarchaeia archaeon]
MLPEYTTSTIKKKAVLALADGTTVYGVGFGAVARRFGEVVFNTGMVGYAESLTDPSYNGQILLQTYPLIGNYGVSPEHYESDSTKVEGYVVRELCKLPSHWSSNYTLDAWLEDEGVPAIEMVDTRMLTKKLRIHGVMLGVLWVYNSGDEPDRREILEAANHIPDPNKTDLVKEVAVKKTVTHDTGGRYTVALLDCGVKRSIIRSLTRRGLNVVQMSPNTPADAILGVKPDGLVISNGPGDPKMAPYIIETVKALLDSRLPTLGICLGVQLLALAAGADTYKLKFGHRGQNHPVVDVETKACYITSQNHGYAVDPESLKGTDFNLKFINANDHTVEGVKHSDYPILGVQFHPEASPGPEDTAFVFDYFRKEIEKNHE